MMEGCFLFLFVNDILVRRRRPFGICDFFIIVNWFFQCSTIRIGFRLLTLAIINV